MQPTPQPKPQLSAADEERAIAAAVINPSILLMDVSESLKILLARDTVMEPGAIELRGVRLIEIPLGWRLALLRLASRFCRIRLPDEFEFAALHIDTSTTPSRVSSGKTVVGHAIDAQLLIQLTGAEYWSLCLMNGRTLHHWVLDRFGSAYSATAVRSLKRKRAA